MRRWRVAFAERGSALGAVNDTLERDAVDRRVAIFTYAVAPLDQRGQR